MNDVTVNNDELSTTVQSMTRGTDNNGNYMFEPYDAKAPVQSPAASHRVSNVMYKTNTKTGTIAGANSCLILPKITEYIVVENIERLIKHVCSMLEGEQDKIIKRFHLDKVSFVEPKDISIDAIISSLEAVAVSGRINKVMIDEWFAAHVSENLTSLVSTARGLAKDDEKVVLQVGVYKNSYNKLASNTTVYQPEQAKMLLDAMDKAEVLSTDSITIKLREKLAKMANPPAQDELLMAL